MSSLSTSPLIPTSTLLSVVKSDNGPPFNGYEFAQFADYLGFKHSKVTPLWPEVNG